APPRGRRPAAARGPPRTRPPPPARRTPGPGDRVARSWAHGAAGSACSARNHPMLDEYPVHRLPVGRSTSVLMTESSGTGPLRGVQMGLAPRADDRGPAAAVPTDERG